MDLMLLHCISIFKSLPWKREKLFVLSPVNLLFSIFLTLQQNFPACSVGHLFSIGKIAIHGEENAAIYNYCTALE